MTSLIRSESLSFVGQHFFITGGTGFIGRSLLDYLDESYCAHIGDFRATVLSRDPALFLEQFPNYRGKAWLSLRKGDLFSLPDPFDGYTRVVHCAADTHRVAGKIEWYRQIVDGTRNVLEFTSRAGVGRFLLASSGAVCGRDKVALGSNLTDEDVIHAPATVDPSSVYANGKRAAEHLCALYGDERGVQSVIARYFAIVSEHVPLAGPYAIGNFLRDALDVESRCIRYRGQGRAVRSYLYGRDMAHWTFKILEAGDAGGVYNVGSDQAISIKELAALVGEVLAPDKMVAPEPPSRSDDESFYVPSIAKAVRLGLRVETSLRAALTEVGMKLRARRS